MNDTEPQDKAPEAPVEDKRKAGPRDENPIDALAEVLAGWAYIIRQDPAVQSILSSVPRQARRELARRFAALVVSLREEA